MLKTGILWIRFKEGVSDETISDIISENYRQNQKFIVGTDWGEFRDEKAFEEFRKKYNDFIQE